MSFDIFGQTQKDSIKLGYISPNRGYVDGVTICEANKYAKNNPRTIFILSTRNFVKYLNINQVNNLTTEDLISAEKPCEGIVMENECGPTKVYFHGGGGIGAEANPIIGLDGALLAIDLISGGFGYQYPPIVEVKDSCGIGAGSVANAVLGEVIEELEFYDEEYVEIYDFKLCPPGEVENQLRYDPEGKVIGEWDPKLYAPEIPLATIPTDSSVLGGVVTNVIISDPGNSYPQPTVLFEESSDRYPVCLILDDVIVEDSGINYNCGVDKLQIIPDNGVILDYTCDTFGRISKVKILDNGSCFPVYPQITMQTDTGINATFRPVFRVVRDPVDPALTRDKQKLIQVTDLVGLKLTGYVNGRPYYGAVLYENGIRFAGYYKTIGTPLLVYDTLQESIDAQITTPPSAIQRQGTDVRSNNPRLNIPGTPGEII